MSLGMSSIETLTTGAERQLSTEQNPRAFLFVGISHVFRHLGARHMPLDGPARWASRLVITIMNSIAAASRFCSLHGAGEIFEDHDAEGACSSAPPATRGCCCVMQCIPPPFQLAASGSILTISRSGKHCSSNAAAV